MAPRQRRTAQAAVALCMGAALSLPAAARPITTREGVLPYGSELGEDSLDLPTELFEFEKAGGKRSYLLNLGDMLFSSPAIFGGVARKAGISCNTCHQQGAGNPNLYITGHSTRPGNFDTSGPLFNPKADNGVLDPLTPPSLRGAKHLAPYGKDGRIASLREFIRNVVVNEFAGPEPSAQALDSLTVYVQEISFLPNPQLDPGGALNARASASALRGEKIFARPFPKDPTTSCASCHAPSGAFVDHRTHDIGTGGLFKTPTLINANVNAPYFHDGRFDSYEQVVAYFDTHFALGLGPSDRSDLVAYLNAVGGAEKAVTRNSVQAELDEIGAFASVLETAIADRDREIVSLAVESVSREWRELGENFPARSDPTVRGGVGERASARGAVASLVLGLRRIDMAAAAGDYAAAAAAWALYRNKAQEAGEKLKSAEPWSLFDPQVRAAHFRALEQLTSLAK